MLFKNWIYVILILVLGIKYGTAQMYMSNAQIDAKITQLDTKWGFSEMSSDDRIDMLLNRKTKEMKSDYLYYKKLVKAKQEEADRIAKVKAYNTSSQQRADEWRGWKIDSKTTSNVGGKRHLLITYTRELYGKTTYVLVHYINGLVKSRTKTVL